MDKKEKTFKILRIIIIALVFVSIAFALFIGRNLYYEFEHSRKQAEASKLYSEMVEKFRTPEPTVTPTPTLKPAEPEPEPEPTPKTIKPEFLELRKFYDNEDIVGYLKIEDTKIDYPVVQYEDNDYYLTRDIYKNPSSGGWIYLDFENNVLLEDKNTVIYGHNMNQNIMFHGIRFFTDEEYFKNHKYITFNTIYDSYTWEIFSFYKTMTIFFYHTVLFNDQQEFEDLLYEMKSRSMYDTGVSVSAEDRVLTLSTCTNAYDDERFVINARLMTPDEVMAIKK